MNSVFLFNMPFFSKYCNSHRIFLKHQESQKKLFGDEKYNILTDPVYSKLLKSLQDTFVEEYKYLVGNKIYFYGCPLIIYEKTYGSRWKEYKEKYTDVQEVAFINLELKKGILKNIYKDIDQQSGTNIYYSLVARFDFLKEKLRHLGYDLIYFPNKNSDLEAYQIEENKEFKNNVNFPSDIQSLNWQLSEIELIELTKALIENKKIIGLSDKKVFESMSEFFGVDITVKKDSKLQTIKQRVVDTTPFLDNLSYAMKNWINKS